MWFSTFLIGFVFVAAWFSENSSLIDVVYIYLVFLLSWQLAQLGTKLDQIKERKDKI